MAKGEMTFEELKLSAAVENAQQRAIDDYTRDDRLPAVAVDRPDAGCQITIMSSVPSSHLGAVFSPCGRYRWIVSLARNAERVVCAWGAHGKLLGRSRHVLAMFWSMGVKPHALVLTDEALGAPSLRPDGDPSREGREAWRHRTRKTGLRRDLETDWRCGVTESKRPDARDGRAPTHGDTV